MLTCYIQLSVWQRNCLGHLAGLIQLEVMHSRLSNQTHPISTLTPSALIIPLNRYTLLISEPKVFIDWLVANSLLLNTGKLNKLSLKTASKRQYSIRNQHSRPITRNITNVEYLTTFCLHCFKRTKVVFLFVLFC